MTVEICSSFCKDKGYQYSGTENSKECYCDSNASALVSAGSACSYTCSGDQTEICGGNNALSVLQRLDMNITIPISNSSTGPSQTTMSTSTVSTSLSASTTSGISSSSASSTISTLTSSSSASGNWSTSTSSSSSSSSTAVSASPSNAICLTDYYPNYRTFSGASFTSDSMTPSLCNTFCSSQGYAFAGTEYARECYCSMTSPSTTSSSSGCLMPCAGDSTSICGGSNALSVLAVVPAHGDYSLQGCYTDNYPTSRVLSGPSLEDHGMTVGKCLDFCNGQGFPVAGLEYYYQCFCGSQLDSASLKVSDSDCNTPCDGYQNQICGGSNRLSVYQQSQS